MKISLGSWAFSFGPYASNPIPFEAAVRRLAKAGYDGIEVSGFPPYVTLEQYPTEQSRRELAGFLSDHGLGISGYAGDFGEANPAAPDSGKRYLELLRRNVEMCAAIGSPSLRVDTGAAPGSIGEGEYEAAFHRISGLWHQGAEIAAAAGVRLIWEFEPGFAMNKPREVIRMHQEVSHQNFSILFDTCHAYMCAVVGARQSGEKDVVNNGVAGFLEQLHGRIGGVHLVDSDGTLYRDETSRHCPFGMGLIDFDALAPRLLAAPGVEWWSVDLSFWPGAWELVESSREYVARLLRRHGA